MKRNNKLALIALSLIALGSTPVLAQNHWGYGDGMQQRGGTPRPLSSRLPHRKSMMITIPRPARCANS